MTSLLYIFLQACLRTMVHRSPGSHEKIIYMNIFVVPIGATKTESCTW